MDWKDSPFLSVEDSLQGWVNIDGVTLILSVNQWKSIGW